MNMPANQKSRWFRLLRYASAALVPVVLAAGALVGQTSPAVLSALFLLLAMTPFFLGFERSRPQARQVVPIAILSALAAVGRVAFAFAPNFKPTTAIILVSGFCFGPSAGFLTGAVAALASNFFFGQGAWTPWQMAAWGLTGLLAGLFRDTRLTRSRLALAVAGAAAALLFGAIMNLWHILGFIRPLTVATVLAAYAASLPFDIAHAASSAAFLLVLGRPWIARIDRVRRKYGLDAQIDSVSTGD